MNARQRRHRRAARSPVEAFSGVAICVASLQERLGLTTIDANFCAMWLTRDKLGTTFLAHLGLMDLSDLLGLSKGLEDRRKDFDGLLFRLRTSSSLFFPQ